MTVTRIVETWIGCEPNLVFDTLADLRRYGEWLPPSSVFRGTTAICEGPIRPGTTYVETSPWGTRRGVVTAMHRPVRISYRQPMTLHPAWLGMIDVQVEDTLEAAGSETRLTPAPGALLLAARARQGNSEKRAVL